MNSLTVPNHKKVCSVCGDKTQKNVQFTYKSPDGKVHHICLLCRETGNFNNVNQLKHPCQTCTPYYKEVQE